MADPVIVPPAPVVQQGEPVDNSPGIEEVQKAFDRAYPDIRPKQQEPLAQPETEREEKVPVPPEVPAPEPEPEPAEAKKLPSFLEEALKVERPRAAEPPKPPEEEFPEELPAFKTGEEAKERYHKWREAYNNLKRETTELKARPLQDEATTARLQQLEQQNQEMGQVLSRMGVEGHAEFQNNILRPMAGEWYEAARIVKEAGGDPQALAKALSLTGRAQYEALDEIFIEMPESAKVESQQHIANWRRLNEARQQALANAPAVVQELRKKDLARQYQVFHQQREEQKALFETALKRLRDEAKVEILQRSDSRDAKWWNEQADQVENNARELYMENTDMGKMAMAALLAPMADVYRKLWLTEREAHTKTRKTLDSRYEGEPSLSESSGPGRTPDSKMMADLKRPFSQVFLEEFHRQRNRNR
jgi:hypothetical protein